MALEAREQLTDVVRRLAHDRNDWDAWEILFVVSWPTALAAAHRILGGQLDLAEDVAQETYRRLLRYCDFGKFLDGDSFLAYLQTVSRNLALDFRRKLARSPERQSAEQEVERGMSGSGQDLERSIHEAELRRKLQQELSDEERKLFALLLERCSVAEIASKLDVSYSAAGVRVHRLRGKLRKRLTDLEL